MEPRRVISEMITEESIQKAFECIKNDTDFAVAGGHYVVLREDRRNDLARFMRENFLPDEPLNKCISLPWSDDLENIFGSQLKEHLSLALVSDSDEEIMGVRLAHISKRTNKSAGCKVQCKKLAKILKLLSQLEDSCDQIKHCEVNKAVSFLGFAVHKDYRHRGIGTKLMKCSIAFLKALGCGPVVVQGEGTANYSKRIFEKLGFETLSEVNYEEHKENGEVVFKDMGEEKSARLYRKIVY